MYCKNCGAENSSTANYCINDGAPLKSIPIKYRNKEQTSKFCSKCGSKSSALYNYCQDCGSSTIQYTRMKNSNPKLPVSKDRPYQAPVSTNILSGFNLAYIKKAIFPALLAIILLFLMSFSMMKTSEKMYNNLLNDEMKCYDINNLVQLIESETDRDLPKVGKLIGISDIVMLSNLQNPEIAVKVNGEIFGDQGKISADAKSKNGFLIYLLIPFIALFAAGIFAGYRNKRRTITERFYDSLGIGILYALFFTIFSFFAGFSYDVNMHEKQFNIAIDINTHYSFVKTFFMTLLFGIFFSSLGNLFSIRFRKVTGHLAEWIPSGVAIHQAISVPFRGILIIFAILFIYLSSKFADFKEDLSIDLSGSPLSDILDKSYTIIGTMSVQLGCYLWNLIHLSPLTFMGNEKGIKGTIEYSIFSGFKTTGEAGDMDIQSLESLISSTDFEMYLKLAILLPILLFIWAGFQMAKQPNVMKNLLIFSIVYSIIMLGIASFSDVVFSFSAKAMEDTENMSMELGFKPFGIFIRSLIFSFVFAYLGTWINKLKANQ
jgi:hypothetical protein